MLAKVVAGVAEAVPGVGLPGTVAELLEQDERLLAACERLLVVTEQGLKPADMVEGVGLPVMVAGGPVQAKGVAGVVDGLCRAVPTPPQVAQVLVGVGLPDLVTGLGGQVEGVAQLGVSVVEATNLGIGDGEVAGLRGRVG